jgi:hypothetical protein
MNPLVYPFHSPFLKPFLLRKRVPPEINVEAPSMRTTECDYIRSQGLTRTGKIRELVWDVRQLFLFFSP